MVSDTSEFHRSTLRALTSLMSQWSSLDLQRRIAATCGVQLDPAAVRALYVLGIAGVAVRPSMIADELHLSRPSTSKVIARLAAAELIDRTSDPDDGRGSHILLTPAGERTYGVLVDAGIRMIADSTARWDPADVRTFSELLTRFTVDLPAAGPEAS